MTFKYEYRIMYLEGQVYESKNQACVEVTKEEYKKIIQGELKEIPIIQIEGISEVIDKMTETVRYIDQWSNRDGSMRKTPLKKPRNISKFEFYMPQSEYLRLKRMKDPIETLERPEEHMTIYRNDGSNVRIVSENGKVKIYDSRDKRSYSIVEADQFLSNITR